MKRTAIEWTDTSWNPGVFGCREVSPACANCYAAKMAHRQIAMGNYPAGITTKRASGVHWSGKVELASLEDVSRSALDLPVKQPARVFVTSMSDLFLDEVSDDFLVRVFAEMAVRPHLTFQLLTKRPERALRFFRGWHIDESVMSEAEFVARKYLRLEHFVWDGRGSDPNKYGGRSLGNCSAKERLERIAQRRAWPAWPLPNVWLGCTVEDQARADERIPLLLQIPARVRFLSCEPLLGPVDLGAVRDGSWYDREGATLYDALRGSAYYHDGTHGLGGGPRIDWVIAGGESGGRARPSDPAWFRSLRDQCSATSVPFLFKQWGEWGLPGDPPWGRYDGATFPAGVPGRPGDGSALEQIFRVGKRAAGRLLDGVEHSAFPVPR